MILSRNMLKRVGESKHPCWTPTVVRNQSPMLLLKRTAVMALSEVSDDSDKVGADVVLLYGCPQSCMPDPVNGLEVYEDMVEVLLVLEIFLIEDSWVEDLLCGAPAFSETCLFFSDDILRPWLQSVQYDLQNDFAWVTDEADRSVVLTLLHLHSSENIFYLKSA